jgi:hypothetical protein
MEKGFLSWERCQNAPQGKREETFPQRYLIGNHDKIPFPAAPTEDDDKIPIHRQKSGKPSAAPYPPKSFPIAKSKKHARRSNSSRKHRENPNPQEKAGYSPAVPYFCR